jgi:hypothetical protein
MPNVGQHGCPGAPQASHAFAAHMVSGAMHGDPGATHLFVAGSQHAVEMQAGPAVQHGKLSAPQVRVVDAAPEHPWYDAICWAQLALTAASVDGASSVPSLAHFCCA